MFIDIQNLFLKQHGYYAQSLQFETIVIFIITLVILTRYFEKSYGFVIILIVFALYMSNTYVSIKNNKLNDFNSITMIRLQTLQSKVNQHTDAKLKLISASNPNTMTKSDIQKIYNKNILDSMHVDSNLIHFLYSIVKLNDYNEYEFSSLLKGTNNILRIKNDIDRYYNANGMYPENTSELLQETLRLKTNVVNNMHNFIYSIPKTKIMYKYLDDCISRFSILISRVTDDVHTNYKNNIAQRGLNSSTNFVTYNNTKPFDSFENHSVIITKDVIDKRVQFYT